MAFANRQIIRMSVKRLSARHELVLGTILSSKTGMSEEEFNTLDHRVTNGLFDRHLIQEDGERCTVTSLGKAVYEYFTMLREAAKSTTPEKVKAKKTKKPKTTVELVDSKKELDSDETEEEKKESNHGENGEMVLTSDS